MKIFEQRRISPEGLVLSRAEFLLASDEEQKQLCPVKSQRIIEEAEELLSEPLAVLTLSSYRRFDGKGVIEDYGAPFAGRLKNLLRLGFAEVAERKGRFTEKFCDYLWAMLEESSWVVPEHTVVFPQRSRSAIPPVVGQKYMHGVELASAYRAAGIALLCHLLREEIDAVSPLILERAEQELKRRAIDPYLSCHFHWSGDFGNRPNNWCPWIVSNILLVTALVENDDYNRTRVVKLALRHLDNFINRYAEDGGCDEGPTYWGAAAGALFDSLELLYDMTGGRINVFDEPLIRNMGEYLPCVNILGKRFANFADSSASAVHDGNMIGRFGRKCASAVLHSFGEVMASISEPYFNFHHPYRMYRSLLTPSILGKEVEPVAKKLSYLPDLKILVGRESTDPRVGLCLAMKGGNNAESHNHNDVGSFIVYKDGEPVLIDVGVGKYTKQTFSPDRYKIWSMRSAYHNLPIIGGAEQRNGAEYLSSDECFLPEEGSLTMELKHAYPIDAGIIRYRRTCGIKDGVISVTEDMLLCESKAVDFILMTTEKPLAEDGRISLCHGVVLNYPPSLAVTVEEIDPVGINTAAVFGTEKLHRIHLLGSFSEAKLQFTLSKK